MHLNPSLEGFFEVGHMGDGQDTGKVRGDRINRGNQAIATFAVLGTKAFIHNQHLQSGARALR